MMTLIQKSTQKSVSVRKRILFFVLLVVVAGICALAVKFAWPTQSRAYHATFVSLFRTAEESV